jgi:DNA-binding PadR family transcriptional regulator
MSKMFDLNNQIRNLTSQENLEIGRNLIISVSNAVAEAAAAAKRNLGESAADSSEPTHEDQILIALKDGALSSVNLRKKIADLNGGLRPNQSELTSAMANLVAQLFVAEQVNGERKLYELTELGLQQASRPEPSPSGTDSSKCNCGNHSLGTLKAAQRLSSVVLDVTTNGTKEQQQLAAKELEHARTRILQILADSQID